MNQYKQLAHELKTTFGFNSVEVIDEKHLHHKHQNFQLDKAYLRLIIYTQQKNTIDLQRRIMKHVMNTLVVHALAIEVKTQ